MALEISYLPSDLYVALLVLPSKRFSQWITSTSLMQVGEMKELEKSCRIEGYQNI